MRKYLVLFIALLLVSCSTFENRVALTVTHTQTINPTDFPTSTQTLVLQTSSPTDPPVSVFSPTPDPTPDGRIIVGQPVDYIPKYEELSQWYWNPGVGSWDSPITNEQIITLLGEKEGHEYIQKTGRKSGQNRCLMRKTGNDYLPEIICFRVIFYDSMDGAGLALSPDWDPLGWYADETLIEGNETLGEESFFTYTEQCVTEDECDISYTVRFRIRNVQGVVNIRGRKGFIDTQYLIDVGRYLESILIYAPTMYP
ncbi:MAG: hypothetical protein PVF83_16610 [Anaerolineales bacterium]|jgi:hypothetical protein